MTAIVVANPLVSSLASLSPVPRRSRVPSAMSMK
jgi:hypothetical protein